MSNRNSILENASPIEIPILVVIATVGILVFIFFIIFFVIFYQKRNLQLQVESEEKEKLHQQQLLKTSLEIAELERKKIAENLHDDIGPIINMIKHNVSQLNAANTNHVEPELKHQTDKLLDTTMDNIRSITRELAPPALMRFGLHDGLNELCSQLSNTKIIEAEFNCSVSNTPLPFTIQIQFYRLIQEIINNVIKHANASKLNLSLIYSQATLQALINHNGKGISNEKISELTQQSSGLGLRSIKNRAEILKANVNYSVANNQPTITISLPIEAYEKAN